MEQKLELIDILNSKNTEITELQAEITKLKEEHEEKIQKQESTNGSSSLGINQSGAISALFKLMGV